MGHGQRGIMVNIEDRDEVPWGMGHMGDGTHGQWGTWAIGHMIITSLILHGSLQKFLLHIDIDVFYLNIL